MPKPNFMPSFDSDLRWVFRLVRWAGLVVVCGVAIFVIGCPYLHVYQQHMQGRAELAKAEYSKQILVQDAKARQESAEYLAKAEITRAEGVAKANQIIGESLKDNEAYLRYLWIHNLEEGNHDVIYVPTEAGLPVLEAGGRFNGRGLGSAVATKDVDRPEPKAGSSDRR
ncbi:hypothetical protein [Aquisphaera insulae]|uniref:hypothetical protein n=1 Tax=Aquisphaera insulae TaxID=2712864 RepID=UPI00196B843F|nr:hypothetical protein [Aquisphaera insulae]